MNSIMGYDAGELVRKKYWKYMIITLIIINLINVFVIYAAENWETVKISRIVTRITSALVLLYYGGKIGVENNLASTKHKISLYENPNEITREDLKKEYNELIKNEKNIEDHYLINLIQESLVRILGLPILFVLVLSFESILLTKNRTKELKNMTSNVEVASDCKIKGNVEYDGTEKIYHLPGCSHYDETVINEYYGEKYFCSEKEAQNAGWRKCRDY